MDAQVAARAQWAAAWNELRLSSEAAEAAAEAGFEADATLPGALGLLLENKARQPSLQGPQLPL